MTIATSLPSPGRSSLVANLACMGSMLVWALGFPLADALLATLPAVAVTALRLAFAAAFLLPVWIIADGWREVRAADWARGLGVGALGMGLGALLLVYGQSRTDGITAAVISATMPVVGITLECLLDGRRLRPRVILGILLSVAGGVAVYGARMGNLSIGIGAAAVLASVTIFAWASRASVTALPGLSAIGRTAVTITGGTLAIAALQALLPAFGGEAMPWARIGARDWVYAALYGVGSMAISQVLFLIGVAGLGIGVAAMHINIAPFYVMLFALAFGAAWSWPTAAAAALVVLGVLIAQGRRPA
ncbi:EamA family transporter [Albidovulum sp.]|uniref:EamA family transporter n=1 Tax=Albidovulum sp. TaxID=1872424 RepID=UPI0039B954D2